jgi:hypothetical protein
MDLLITINQLLHWRWRGLESEMRFRQPDSDFPNAHMAVIIKATQPWSLARILLRAHA